MPVRAGVRRFVPRTAQPLGDARDVAQQSPLLERQVVVKGPKLQVVRDEKAERTKIVQNKFKTVNLKGVEEALPRPASNGASLVNETGFSADRDLRFKS